MTTLNNEKRGYKELFKGVLNEIQQSRIKAASATNRIIGEMNFKIGRIITENQEKYGWGNQ